jgi:type IV pilus assembly protein PilM
MFGLRKKILGVDFGRRSLKGVLLSKRGGEVYLDDYFYLDLKETLENGYDDQRFPAAFRALVEGIGLRNLHVASALEDKDVQLMPMHFPPLSENEIRDAVANELEVKLGVPAKDLSFDFNMLRARHEGTRSGGDHNVITAYTRLEVVKSHLDFLSNAKLKPYSVESALQASVEALRFNGYLPEDGSCVVVDGGEAHTSVGLVSQGELVQVNVIRSGSGDINQSLMQQLQWTYGESELLKISHRLEGEESGAHADAAGKLVEQGYYQIMLGIHDTVAYFRASRKDLQLQKVLVSGGAALKEGVPALLEQSLALPVEVANPLKNIQIFHAGETADQERLPRIGQMLHVAVGLALRGAA